MIPRTTTKKAKAKTAATTKAPPHAARKPKLTSAGDPLRGVKYAVSARFLDDDRIAVALIGKAAKQDGGERCSIVHLANGKEQVLDPDLYAVNPGMVAFDPHSQRILFAMVSDITLFDAKKGAALTRFKTTGEHVIQAASFSPDGALACVGSGASIDLWDTANAKRGKVAARYSDEMPMGKPSHSFKPKGHRIGTAFNADGSLLAVSMSDYEDGTGVLEIRSTKSKKVVVTAKWKEAITSFDFAPDGQSIYVALTTARVKFGQRGAGKGRIEVIDLQGKKIGGWASKTEIIALRFLASGALVALDDKAIRVVDPAKGDDLALRAQKAASRGVPAIADVRGDRFLTVGPLGLFALE